MLKPTSIDELHSLAENAAHLARIIRQWLPITGDTEAKAASWRTAERWFYQAGEHFTACERIRNPHKLPFGRRGGSYHGPSACSAAWFELSEALDAIAVVYRLEPVADESGIPHLPFQQAVPVIESGILRRLELAASEILEAVRDEVVSKPGPVVQPVATGKPKKRTRKPTMGKEKVAAHWKEVMTSGDRNLIAFYLSAGEVELAKKIGTSRGTLRSVEAFQHRTAALLAFNRENR